jgi:hypothetical protein
MKYGVRMLTWILWIRIQPYHAPLSPRHWNFLSHKRRNLFRWVTVSFWRRDLRHGASCNFVLTKIFRYSRHRFKYTIWRMMFSAAHFKYKTPPNSLTGSRDEQSSLLCVMLASALLLAWPSLRVRLGRQHVPPKTTRRHIPPDSTLQEKERSLISKNYPQLRWSCIKYVNFTTVKIRGLGVEKPSNIKCDC